MSDTPWELNDMVDGEGEDWHEPVAIPRTARDITWALAIEFTIILAALFAWHALQ